MAAIAHVDIVEKRDGFNLAFERLDLRLHFQQAAVLLGPIASSDDLPLQQSALLLEFAFAPQLGHAKGDAPGVRLP